MGHPRYRSNDMDTMKPILTYLSPVVLLAEKAGSAIMDIYGRATAGMEVEQKADNSPLTAADRVAHQIIAEGLDHLTPGIPFISEEGTPSSRDAPRDGLWWAVDPLDGTKEFLKKTGEFTVNIALIDRARPLAGVIHAPALGRSWLGASDGAERRAGLETQSLRVRTAAQERLGVVASRDHAGLLVQKLLARSSEAEALSMGSSLKFCLIAEGRADLYVRDGPTMEWDTAAGHAILRAAGGEVYTLDGIPLTYGKPELRNSYFVAVGDMSLPWRSLFDHGQPKI